MNIINALIKIAINRKLRKINHGKNVQIGINVHFNNPKNIYIGDNSYVNGGYLMAGENSKIVIGKNCLLSYNIHIRTTSHNFKDKGKLIREQGEFENDIIIDDDCWIGFGAQILPGRKIAKGCVIGAGAVVTHDTEPYSIYAGVPARKIGERQ